MALPSGGDAPSKAATSRTDAAAVFVLALAQGVSGTFVYGFLSDMVPTFSDLGDLDDAETNGAVLALVSCFGLGQVLGTPLWGWLTDVTAPRPVFNLCLGFSVVAVTLFGLAQRFWWACALRFLGGLVDGVNLVLITFMADVMRRAEKSGSAIVVTISQICGIGIGLGLGIWVGGLSDPVRIYGWHSSHRLVAILAEYPFLFPCLISAALNLMAVFCVMRGDVGLRGPPPSSTALRGFASSVRAVLNGQVIVAMTVLMALYLGMTAYAMVAVKWVLAPTSARGLGFDPVQKLVYTFAAILLSILLQLLCAGKIIERFGYRDACVACAWFATAPYALNGLSGYVLDARPLAGWALLVGTEALRKLLVTVSSICAIHVAVDAVPRDLQGTCNGVLLSGLGLGCVLGPIVGGLLWEASVTSPWPFPFNFYSAFLAILAAQAATAYFGGNLDVADPSRPKEATDPAVEPLVSKRRDS